MTYTNLAPALALALALVTGCAAIEPSPGLDLEPPADEPTDSAEHARLRRGELVSATHLRRLAAGEVATILGGAGFDATLARHGVDTYRLVYRTIDPKGRPTTATGLVALPRGTGPVLRAVSYTHGTEVYRGDAPSAQERCAATTPAACPDAGWAVGPALTYATAGFAALAPDYLGLGDGPGPHPWMDVPSETSAALDLVRAAGRLALENGRFLRREVLVTGFSQGASAALGLARALDEGADPWFRLGAVAPISGAYDWSGWVRSALDGEVWPLAASFYLSYLLVSWNRLHPIYTSPTEVFDPQRAAATVAVFDGEHTGGDVVQVIGPDPDSQLTAAARATLRNPTGPLAAAFAVADATCTGWRPSAPVRLIFSSGDVEVPPASTGRCRASFNASGAAPAAIDLGDLDHLATNLAGTAATARWFRTLP